MDFNTKYSYFLDLVGKYLDETIIGKDTPEKTIYDAMKYSLMAGGKRIRPVLSLGVCEMLEGNLDDVMPYACGIEMIHTYSLIHDDLPAMDNDDYRRGRLTSHKVYGEAVAVLAGDALLNFAFETMLGHTIKSCNNINLKVRAMEIIANASGASGMIGGQVVDLESEGRSITKETLNYMHKCKTGALIKASVMSAAVISGADETTAGCLEEFSELIGLAFQIKDDILDVEGNLDTMGKKGGSDASNNKSTFVTLYGLEESKKMLDEVNKRAILNLEGFGEKAEFLKNMAIYIGQRKN